MTHHSKAHENLYSNMSINCSFDHSFDRQQLKMTGKSFLSHSVWTCSPEKKTVIYYFSVIFRLFSAADGQMSGQRSIQLTYLNRAFHALSIDMSHDHRTCFFWPFSGEIFRLYLKNESLINDPKNQNFWPIVEPLRGLFHYFGNTEVNLWSLLWDLVKGSRNRAGVVFGLKRPFLGYIIQETLTNHN